MISAVSSKTAAESARVSRALTRCGCVFTVSALGLPQTSAVHVEFGTRVYTVQAVKERRGKDFNLKLPPARRNDFRVSPLVIPCSS